MDVNSASYRMTEAAGRDNLDEIMRLLDLGIPADCRNSYGWTAFMTAVWNGKDRCADALVNAGADINALDTGGNSVLSHACIRNEPECIKRILKYGPNLDLCETNGDSPLYKAVKENNPECVKLLLDAGANVNKKGAGGWTPLHRASRQTGCDMCVKLLIEAGADINIKDNWGRTPLYIAAESRLVSVMKSLIKAGADPLIQGISGFDSIQTLKFTSPVKYKKYSGELIALAEKVRTSRLEKEDMRKKTVTGYEFDI